MRKGNIRKMLAAIVLTLLCGSAFAQRIVESGDLRIITDEQRGTAVHYLKDGNGRYRASTVFCGDRTRKACISPRG